MQTIKLRTFRPSYLDDLFKRSEMLPQNATDVTLCCSDGQKFFAHRTVLSAVSLYLQEVLLAGQSSSKEPTTNLILPKVESPELAALLDLVYKGSARLSAERLEHFWRVTKTLGIRLPIVPLSDEPEPLVLPLVQSRSTTTDVPRSTRTRVANHVTASPWSQTLRLYHSPRLQPMLLLLRSKSNTSDKLQESSGVDGDDDDEEEENDRQNHASEDRSDGFASESSSKVQRSSPWKCRDCGKEFSQLRNYKYHRSQHEGTREFAVNCPECGKRLNDRGYLSSHMKIHLNRKEYSCEQCGKSFNQRVAYSMHLRVHSGLKPHRCEQCGKQFGRKMLLKQHLRTHSGERPYACPHCRKTFADRSNMSLHVKLHSGLKPYQCSLCPKAFSKNHHLKTHLNSHTGSKPYSCPYCDLAFSQSSNMRTHAKKCALRDVRSNSYSTRATSVSSLDSSSLEG